jgi:hypothetical protein
MFFIKTKKWHITCNEMKRMKVFYLENDTAMKRTKIIQLNNKKIFLCDLKGVQNEDLLEVSHETWNMFNTELKEGEKVSFLIDITNVDIPPSLMEEISELASRYKQSIEKEGVIGFHGFKKTLLNLYSWASGSQLKAFETQERAMLWLAS